ncbi:GNAT family N-acetyltransferase [Deinococcus cellulosilyticus]|uniref:N-acetyltransferase n=1 Tax=Deinococcus cellulosilyticus (strain DSM 18568 / NBRC 106333 / KACC 11606 / 5516J-15) TaxID=1223518 RepID=A0A511N3H4_DEIC1|nr:GNAT family N-acetyltransferase [Deinococcus cellulosilyticus]GEM47413.1 N-acetyltransferase [Deinococcus cellulosilyticus NBRC 106333 = KACC 11606]
MPEIRVLNASDAPIYRELRLQALTHDPNAFLVDPDQYRQMPLETIEGQLSSEEDGKFTLGAFLDEKLVGMCTFIRESHPKIRHKGKVVAVYVAPEARGQGVARKLMETLIERVRSYGDVEQIQLGVSHTQVAAQKLYTRLGFEIFGIEKQAVKQNGEYLDEEWRVLKL